MNKYAYLGSVLGGCFGGYLFSLIVQVSPELYMGVGALSMAIVFPITSFFDAPKKVRGF